MITSASRGLSPGGAATFPHRLGGHCGSSALRDLLEFHRRDYGCGALNEGFVFGVSGGLGFLFVGAPGMRPPLYVVGRCADMERQFAEHFGLGLDVRETDDPLEAWALVKREIDAGRPPMVWADIGHLEYLRVRMHNTHHDIVVVGYDESEGYAVVADNDRAELQRCSLTSLARARDSRAFPGANRHRTFLYDFRRPLRDPHAAVRDGVACAVSNMRGAGRQVEGFSGAHGLLGVEAFAQSYGRWPEVFEDDLKSAMLALAVFITKAGTGGAMFRSLHATFLRDAGELVSDGGLERCAEVYAELAQRWQELATVARGPDVDVAHQAGVAIVASIAELELAGVQQMERWLAARK
jgi:hypothetical protein